LGRRQHGVAQSLVHFSKESWMTIHLQMMMIISSSSEDESSSNSL